MIDWSKKISKLDIIKNKIEEAKNNKKKEVNNWKTFQFNATINFVVGSKMWMFQKDINSKMALSFASNDTEGVDWITFENVTVHLSQEDVIGLMHSISDFDTETVERGRRMKDYIDNFPVDMDNVEQSVQNINDININNIL